MRKVFIDNITPNMELAIPLYHQHCLLLPRGTKGLERYAENLCKLGISSVYIEDTLSADIVIPDAVSEQTRNKCKNTFDATIKQIRSQGSFDMPAVSEAIDALLDDILTRPDLLISLTDIGTTDDSTLVHSVNTTIYSLTLAHHLHIPRLQLKKLAEGALLHDIGKTIIDPVVLYKPGRLSENEMALVKNHAGLSYDIMKRNPQLSELSRLIALQHHERLDGSGYPNAIDHNDIHLYAQIVAIADMYDALTSDRCYRPPMTNYEAYEILMKDSSTRLNHELLRFFFQSIAVYPNGTTVYLSDGRRGIVKEQNRAMPFRPIIRVIEDHGTEEVKLYDLNLLQVLDITIIEASNKHKII